MNFISDTIAACIDPGTGTQYNSAGKMQAYALRQLAFDLARQIGGAKPSDVSEDLRTQANATTQLIRAWAEADERARIARGRPLPGSLRPERRSKAPRAPKGSTAFSALPHIVSTPAPQPSSKASST